MNITVNGNPMIIEQNVLLALLTQIGAEPPFAVAVNGEFIPQSLHGQYQLKHDDSIELLSPIQGG